MAHGVSRSLSRISPPSCNLSVHYSLHKSLPRNQTLHCLTPLYSFTPVFNIHYNVTIPSMLMTLFCIVFSLFNTYWKKKNRETKTRWKEGSVIRAMEEVMKTGCWKTFPYIIERLHGCILFNDTFSVTQASVEWKADMWIKNWKGCERKRLWRYLRYYPTCMAWGKPRKTSVRMPGLRAEIWTRKKLQFQHRVLPIRVTDTIYFSRWPQHATRM
jgi:hypothetical protein